MAPVNIVKVLSVNSEDPVHNAQNLLLKDNPNKKWKSKAPGEKQLVTILQLEEATKITGIDIGNEFSAFVEVLVAKSTSNDNDFKVLLVASCLMSFEESKNGTNTNAVKFFKVDDLSKGTVNESWDRIKIVCTQPFNKHVQYGLSFIIVHSKSTESDAGDKLPNLGKFTWKKKEEDDSTLTAGSLFTKKKLLGEPLIGDDDNASTSGIRSIKVSGTRSDSPESSKAESNTKTGNKKNQRKDASSSKAKNAGSNSRRSIVYEDSDSEEPTRSKNRKKQNDANKKRNDGSPTRKALNGQPSSPSNNEAGSDDDSKENIARNDRQSNTDVGSPSQSSSKNPKDISTRKKQQSENDFLNALGSSSSATSSKKRKKREKVRKNFYELFKDVTFVISGFENPYRSEIRSKALEMGAKYKQDWNSSCTHLICAFPNTPKFNQVKGKGKIVQKEWVEECYSKRRRYPWRRFALDKKDKKKPESEDEIFAALETGESESESESEEEVQRIVRKKKVPNPFDEDTDIDEEPEKDERPVRNSRDTSVTSKLPLPYLPDFFANKTFYLSSLIRDTSSKGYLHRCIVAYKGKLVTDLAVKIHYVVVSNDYDSSSQTNIGLIQESHPDVTIVKEDWIRECSVVGSLVPIEPYTCE